MREPNANRERESERAREESWPGFPPVASLIFSLRQSFYALFHGAFRGPSDGRGAALFEEFNNTNASFSHPISLAISRCSLFQTINGGHVSRVASSKAAGYPLGKGGRLSKHYRATCFIFSLAIHALLPELCPAFFPCFGTPRDINNVPLPLTVVFQLAGVRVSRL